MRRKQSKDSLFKLISLFAVILCVLTASFYVLHSQQKAEPNNPIDGRNEDSSVVRLASETEVLSATDFSDDSSEENEQQNNDGDDNQNDNNTETGEQSTGASVIPSENMPQGSGIKSAVKITVDGYALNEGAILSKLDGKLKFTPTEVGAIIEEINVELNGVVCPEFSINKLESAVAFVEGANTLRGNALVKKSDGTTLTVPLTRNFTVDSTSIIVKTNLKNNAVTESETLEFYVYGLQNGEEVAVEYSLNGGNKKSSSKGQEHNEALVNGLNNIVVYESGKDKMLAEYRITYNKPDVSVRLIVENLDSKVNVSEVSFRAYAEGGTNPKVTKVECNNKTYQPGENDVYRITDLKVGNNDIYIYYENDKDSAYKRFIVKFSPTGGNTDNSQDPDDSKVDPNAPTINIVGIKSGDYIKGSKKTIFISARDVSGKRIYARDMTIQLNGTPLGYVWEDGEQATYNLNVKDGNNTLNISATDSQGRTRTINIRFTGEKSSKGSPIGTATISFEASTIGIPYIISPTKITVYEDEPLSYLTLRVLQENGFEAEIGGNLDANFYLIKIKKDNMFGEIKIPKDLKERWIAENPIQAGDGFPNEYMDKHDELGEFDITPQSGWMVSVNNWYPNVGMSDVYLVDGDVVRWRFTIALGSDINGGAATGTGNWGDW